MKNQSSQSINQEELEAIVIEELNKHPMDLQQVTTTLSERLPKHGVRSDLDRTTRELVWKLVEDGKARINNEWRLEVQP